MSEREPDLQAAVDRLSQLSEEELAAAVVRAAAEIAAAEGHPDPIACYPLHTASLPGRHAAPGSETATALTALLAAYIDPTLAPVGRLMDVPPEVAARALEFLPADLAGARLEGRRAAGRPADRIAERRPRAGRVRRHPGRRGDAMPGNDPDAPPARRRGAHCGQSAPPQTPTAPPEPLIGAGGAVRCPPRDRRVSNGQPDRGSTVGTRSCPRSDSNGHCAGFESAPSADWGTGAYRPAAGEQPNGPSRSVRHR